MVWTFSTHRGEYQCIENFIPGTPEVRDNLVNLDVRITLILIVKKYGWREWIGLNWLTTGTSGRLRTD
jgi:hypothetical protein